MKLSCEVAKDLLPLYHDGVCSEESKALVEAHLNECESCLGLLKELRGEIEVPHEIPDDLGAMKRIGQTVKNGKRKAWIKGAAAVLAAAVLVFAGANIWWYADTRAYYQEFAQGHKPMDAEHNPNVYQWSDEGYHFVVTVPEHPGDIGHLVVDQELRNSTKNIVPGEEISTWLSFGREEYVYWIGLNITTRTVVPGEPRLETVTRMEYVMLDGDLNQVYSDKWDAEIRAHQDWLLENYNREIMDIVRAAQAQWPFLTE